MGFLDWLKSLFAPPPPPVPQWSADPITGRLTFSQQVVRDADRYAAKGGNRALYLACRRLGLRRKRIAYLLYVSKSNYHSHEVPKKNGAVRRIDAPCASLKFVQRRILRRLLVPMQLHPYAHGFRRNHSIFSNARPHVGHEVVVSADLKDFFPSITFGRVRGLFQSLGFDRDAAIVLAKLTTFQDRLPQGAPTSPAISNAVCRKLDRRLAGLAKKAGAAYTRYADDLTFSGQDAVVSILPLVRKILREEGFGVAEHKVHVARRGRRQQVTGLTVNDRVAVPRARRRLVRAMVHNAARDGLAATNRIGHPDYWAYLIGQILFIRQGHVEEGDRLLAAMARVRP
jgi:retron-type reverse transcriptase